MQLLIGLLLIGGLLAPFLTWAKEPVSNVAEDLILMRSMRAAGYLPLDPSPEQVFARLNTIQSNLSELQNQELSEHLRDVYGIETKGKNPYDVFKQISAQNLRRYLGRHPILRTALSNSVQAYVHSQFQGFIHNMNQYPTLLMKQPLLVSSRQLDKMALSPGLQSAPFNRDFLKTQDWIFFHVDGDDKLYGNHGIALAPEYAQSTAIVAPFVMTLGDLIDVGYDTAPERAHELENTIRQLYPEKWEIGYSALGMDKSVNRTKQALLTVATNQISWKQFLANHGEAITAIRASMKNYLFTVKDYESLVTFIVTKYILKMNAANSPELQNWKQNYKKIFKAAMAELHLPDRFELRVPVAIPMRHLSPLNPCASALMSPATSP